MANAPGRRPMAVRLSAACSCCANRHIHSHRCVDGGQMTRMSRVRQPERASRASRAASSRQAVSHRSAASRAPGIRAHMRQVLRNWCGGTRAWSVNGCVSFQATRHILFTVSFLAISLTLLAHCDVATTIRAANATGASRYASFVRCGRHLNLYQDSWPRHCTLNRRPHWLVLRIDPGIPNGVHLLEIGVDVLEPNCRLERA